MHRAIPAATAALFLLLSALGTASAATGAPAFADRFHDETLRVDYFHTGAAGEEIVALDRVHRQGTWAGSLVHLVDCLDLGRYLAVATDVASGEVIFSRGFDSYFGEWATTGPASEGVRRTYHESVLMPLPKAPIRFSLEARRADGTMAEVFAQEIDPAAVEVRRDPAPADAVVVEAAVAGDPHACLDIAILGEGYTAAEAGKFDRDVRRFAGILLGQEPFRSLSGRLSVRGVMVPSQQSGCDEPERGVHRNTALGCTFNSLGSERYLLTEDNRALREVAACVPYDVVSLMVNHTRYGGGGIYNLFNTFTSDNQWSPYVFVHEFGHGFAGLADEYYSSSTAYNDFYPRGVEPRERNITALLAPGGLKWGDLATPGAAAPTAWPKAEHDAADAVYQQRRGENTDLIAKLMRGGAPQAEVDAALAAGEELSLVHQQELDAWFAKTGLGGIVGAFEGAGYCSEGMYRAQLDCIMFTKGLKSFCAACTRGIREVAATYTE
ncbi:MAG: peptidase M64 [bacterium]|nr:peptidase M64 [bacterium]